MKSKAILLSIHPTHVAAILSGKKKYEFRKVIAKKYHPNKIFIYATTPIAKIVVEAEIANILIAAPTKIWKNEKICRYC